MSILDLEPEYFAVVKLSNNDTIIGGITIDEDETGIHIHDPLLLKYMMTVNNSQPVQQVMLTPWILHSSDSVFYIDAGNIITHGELSPFMFDCYSEYVNSESYNSFFQSNEPELLFEGEDDEVEMNRNLFQKLYDQK
jgi:hypothetical protein